MSPDTAAEPPQMPVEDFEELARSAPETVSLEFVNGRLEVKPMPDQLHGAMVMWLLTACMKQRPGLALYPGRASRSGRTAKAVPARTEPSRHSTISSARTASGPIPPVP